MDNLHNVANKDNQDNKTGDDRTEAAASAAIEPETPTATLNTSNTSSPTAFGSTLNRSISSNSTTGISSPPAIGSPIARRPRPIALTQVPIRVQESYSGKSSPEMRARAENVISNTSRRESLEKIYPNIVGDLKKPESPLDNAKLVNMLDEVVKTYFTNGTDETTHALQRKSAGTTDGFIITADNENGCKKYVKSFLDQKIGAKPHGIELFVYKFLEKLGCGAKVEALHCEGKMAFLVSDDLNEQGPLSTGEDAISLARTNLEDQSLKERVIALEILAKVLHLSDLKNNLGNFGIVQKGEELHPVIIDFHFDRKPEDFPLDDKATEVDFSPMVKRFSVESSTPCSTVAITRAFTQTGITRENYDNAMSKFSPSKVESAKEECLAYCQRFLDKLSDRELRDQFDMKVIQKYAAEVSKIFMDKADRFKEVTGDTTLLHHIASPTKTETPSQPLSSSSSTDRYSFQFP